MTKKWHVECWSCNNKVKISAIRDCDGYCPECDAPIDLDEEPYTEDNTPERKPMANEPANFKSDIADVIYEAFIVVCECHPDSVDILRNAKKYTDKIRQAQPAPVVPDEVIDALKEVARIRIEINHAGGNLHGIGSSLWEAEEWLLEMVSRHAFNINGGK